MTGDDKFEPTPRAIKNLMAAHVIQSAETLTILALIEEIARQAGIERIGGASEAARQLGIELKGLAISDWYARERVRALEYQLAQLENESPALAAALQEHIDKAKGHIDRQG